MKRMRCSNRYYNRAFKELVKCNSLKYRGEPCERCAERKIEAQLARRYFPFKYNPNLVLDIKA